MKVVILSQYNVNMFPALFFLADNLSREGAQVRFLSRDDPSATGVRDTDVAWDELPRVNRFTSTIPGLRSNFHGMLGSLIASDPDVIIAQHDYLLPALIYKLVRPRRGIKAAGYFCDHYTRGKALAVIRRLAHHLDAYVDICDMRLHWRQQEWPRMSASSFVLRQAPDRREGACHEPHHGPVRIVFTSSKNVLDMNRDRLSRFISRLCERGLTIDWYVSGSSQVHSSEALRLSVQSLVQHPSFKVREPVEKTELMSILRTYDVGLHWAPMADLAYNPNYIRSAASNKIGEYLAAGLIVAYAGNPGLSYLLPDASVVFDPTDPEAGADQLADALSNRTRVERKREAALHYHLDEMNFTAQAEPFVRYVMGGGFAGRAAPAA